MQLSYVCPACHKAHRSVAVEAGAPAACGACGWTRASDAADASQPVGGCLACGTNDLWRQKDFPPALGLAVVALGVVLSSLAWFYHWPRTALGILMVFALADMMVYAVLPDVLVCYRCKARHYGTGPGSHAAFDHEVAERYRQESLRLREAQRAGTA